MNYGTISTYLPYHVLLAAANDNLTMMLPPPSSEIMPKHDEALGGIGKNISADSWCQCAMIWCHRCRRAATAVAALPTLLRCRANATAAAALALLPLH